MYVIFCIVNTAGKSCFSIALRNLGNTHRFFVHQGTQWRERVERDEAGGGQVEKERTAS